MKNSTVFVLVLLSFFTACTNNKQAETSPTPDYLTLGKTIQGATFTALSSKLQTAMNDGGVEGAVEYCHLAAYPLVDSLSKVYQAEIRRTSLKVRNPLDAPKPREKTLLETYQKQHLAGEPIEATVLEISETEIAYYAPILVNDLCLKCHGQVGDALAEDDYTKILEFYPNDQAVGYTAGDFRGMWSITFFKGE